MEPLPTIEFMDEVTPEFTINLSGLVISKVLVPIPILPNAITHAGNETLSKSSITTISANCPNVLAFPIIYLLPK